MKDLGRKWINDRDFGSRSRFIYRIAPVLEGDFVRRHGRQSTMFPRAAVVLAALVALLCCAPLAQAGVGGLDQTFGTKGKVATPFRFYEGAEVATGPDGSVLLASGSVLTRYTPSGAPDGGFGIGGQVTLPATVEGLNFYPGSIGIDSQGRVLVFGTATDPSREYVDPNLLRGFPASSAMIMRLQAGGDLDPSFGGGKGFTRSDFGLRTDLPATELPTTQVGRGMVDSHDRPVFSVAVLGSTGRCFYGKGFVSPYPKGVVRLTSSGAVDASFGGGDGLTEINGAEGSASLEEDAVGGLVVATENENCRRGGDQVFRLSANGERLASFGNGGILSFAGRYFAAIMASGSIVLAETLRRGEFLTHAVVKTKPDGNLDPNFGKAGRAALMLPNGVDRNLKPVAVDARGRIILVGSFERPGRRGSQSNTRPQSEKKKPSTRSYLFITRLRANGSTDLRFGNRGRIVTQFKRPRLLAIKAAELDSQGRLVIALGSVSAAQLPGTRLTLARYSLNG